MNGPSENTVSNEERPELRRYVSGDDAKPLKMTMDLNRTFGKGNLSPIITASYLCAVVYDDENLVRSICDMYGVSVHAPEAAKRSASEFLVNMLNTRTQGLVNITHCMITRLGFTNYLVAEDADNMYVVFMGTAGRLDAVVDLTLNPAPLVLGDIHVGHAHSGFLLRAEGYSPEFLGFLTPEKRVVFAGHSLGGSVAMIKALEVIHDGNIDQAIRDKVLCVTLGAPMQFDALVREHITRNALGHHFVVFFNTNDPVPLITFDAASKLAEMNNKEDLTEAERRKRERKITHHRRRQVDRLTIDDIDPGDYKPIGKLFELKHSPATATLVHESVFESLAGQVRDLGAVSNSFFHRILTYVDTLDRLFCPGARDLDFVTTLQSFGVIEKKGGDIEGHSGKEKKEMLRAGALLSTVIARWSGKKLWRRKDDRAEDDDDDHYVDDGFDKLFKVK